MRSKSGGEDGNLEMDVRASPQPQPLIGHEASCFAERLQAIPSGTQSQVTSYHQVMLGFQHIPNFRSTRKEWASPMHQAAYISECAGCMLSC